MAKNEKAKLYPLTGTDEGAIPVDAEMPPVEPGHKGASLNPGDVFDPNAARRLAEGRGPGLQDSEIASPAHWKQPGDAGSRRAELEAEKARLEKRIENIDREGKEAEAAASVNEAPVKGEAEVRGGSKTK